MTEARGEADVAEKRFGNPNIKFEPIPLVTTDGISLSLYRMPKDGPPVLLLHGGSSQHDSFCLPRRGGSLAEFLWTQGYEPWLLDWRGSFRVTEQLERDEELCGPTGKRAQLSLDSAARYDVPEAIKKIRAERGDVKVHALGQCLGAGVLAQSIARGYIAEISESPALGRVVMLTLGLFYLPPFSGRLKNSFEVLERLWHDEHLAVVDPRFPEDESKWPPKIRRFYALLGRGAGPHRHQQVDARSCDGLCDRMSFMYGASYVEEQLVPEIHGRWVLQFCDGEEMPVAGDHLRLDEGNQNMGRVVSVDAKPSWKEGTASGTITVTGLPLTRQDNGEFKAVLPQTGKLRLSDTDKVVGILESSRVQFPAELPRQFGAIPLLMYLQAAQNVRRGSAGSLVDSQKLFAGSRIKPEDNPYIGRFAREHFAALDAVTLITGSRNTVWHRMSIDRMYYWLTKVPGRQPREVHRRIMHAYGHQDLLWGAQSYKDVFPTILHEGLGGLAHPPSVTRPASRAS